VKAFEWADTDKDGRISFEEFQQFMLALATGEVLLSVVMENETDLFNTTLDIKL